MENLDLKDEETRKYLIKIGEIIASFNLLESQIEFYIWELIQAKGSPHELQKVGRILTAYIDFMSKADILIRLIAERRGESSSKDFKDKVYQNIKKCSEQRNDIVHSQWYITKGQTFKLNFQDGYKGGREKKIDFSKAQTKISIDDLNKTVVLIKQTTRDLMFFF